MRSNPWKSMKGQRRNHPGFSGGSGGDSEEAGDSARGETGAMEETSGRILIVDDDPGNREILLRRLKRRGYEVTTAARGEEALALLASHEFDLLLLDVVMPDLSGLELLTRIRETHDPFTLPVIMVTGQVKSADIVQALELGANDYITKPVAFSVALARIRTQLTLKRTHEQLQHLAAYDPLTELMNRRTFMNCLEQEIVRARRHRFQLALLLLDIDFFKKVNDHHGHLAGDEVLRRVGEVIQGTLRRSDLAGRFGGEEFCVCMPNTTLSEAKIAAERLREAIARLTFYADDESPFHVTCSIGIAAYDEGISKRDELIQRADEALYRAKGGGRNRVEIGGLPPQTSEAS
ncbi:MAG: diguanylate cyclase [Deltaproteobacteria bacterium]|nr:MAG: diguanylate cyclase [Deltaproteobacteria bacterium]